jgi:catechol 2,3-dioxygenase-like lactoylglutathione lyase family enzyme
VRRPFFSALLLALACATLPVFAGAARGVESISLTVSDAEASARFFTGVLGFTRVADAELSGDAAERLHGLFGMRAKVVRLRLGEEALDLMEFLAPAGRPIPADSRSQDRWFQHIAIVVRDMDEAFRALRAGGVRFASTGPQRLPDWNPGAGGIRAFYFRDPDDHVLEVIHFPPGKGDPRWQRAGAPLFQGIDHTAIVVADTGDSLRFYRDTLGMAVAGESENHGVEQEHLNNVFGARLRITALRAARGPGIELLEYLAPSDGRPYPIDSKPSDLWHWHVRIDAEGVEAAARAGRAAGGSWVSPGAVAMPDAAPGFRRGAMVRDPDRHAILLTEN